MTDSTFALLWLPECVLIIKQLIVELDLKLGVFRTVVVSGGAFLEDNLSQVTTI